MRTTEDVQTELAAASENVAALRAELAYRHNLADRVADMIARRASGEHGGTCSMFPVHAEGRSWVVTVAGPDAPL